MWSKSEAKALRQQFWTTLGKYLAPVPSADGERIHWINYRTGKKGVVIRMEQMANHSEVYLALQHPNASINKLYWNTLKQLASALPDIPPFVWHWDDNDFRIQAFLINTNLLRQEDWPQCISFFKTAVTALDKFWSIAKWHLPDEEDII